MSGVYAVIEGQCKECYFGMGKVCDTLDRVDVGQGIEML